MRKKTLLFVHSSIRGLIVAVALGASFFFLLPRTWITEAYLKPGMLIGSGLSFLLPSQLVYTIVPDGGGPALVLLALIGTLIFWTSVFTAAQLIWHKVSHSQRN